MKKVIIVIAVVVLLGAGAYAWWSVPRKNPYAHVQREKAKRDKFILSIEEVGIIRARKVEPIYTPFGGKITKILDNGCTVTKGQIVVWLDTEDVENKLSDQIINLKSTKTELESNIERLIKGMRSNTLKVESSAADLEFARLKLQEVTHRLETVQLLVDKNIVAKSDAQTQEQNVQSEKFNTLNTDLTFQRDIKDKEDEEMSQAAGLGMVKLRSIRAKKTIEDARAKIADAEIKAPANGLLILTEHWEWENNRNSKPQAGDQVWERQCLAEIPDLSTIIVLSQVSEEDVSKVFIGQEAHITTDAFKDLEIKAKVSRIGMAAILRYASPAGSLSQSIEDTGQKVFELDLAPEKTDSRLRPGMTANISIILETLPNALTLPVSVVFRKEGRSVVYLATKDGYKVQPVTLGRSNRERVEILSGLKENDEVFTKDLSQMENKS